MPLSPVMGKNLPEGDGLRTGCEEKPVANLLARFESVRQRVAVGKDPGVGELDAVVAPWFDAAVDAWGKEDAFAETLGVSRQHVELMRKGKKAVPLRALLPLLQSRAAVLAFVRPLCEAVDLEPPQPRPRVTHDQVAQVALDAMLLNPALLDLLVRMVAERHGAAPEEVVRALRERGK